MTVEEQYEIFAQGMNTLGMIGMALILGVVLLHKIRLHKRLIAKILAFGILLIPFWIADTIAKIASH